MKICENTYLYVGLAIACGRHQCPQAKGTLAATRAKSVDMSPRADVQWDPLRGRGSRGPVAYIVPVSANVPYVPESDDFGRRQAHEAKTSAGRLGVNIPIT